MRVERLTPLRDWLTEVLDPGELDSPRLRISDPGSQAFIFSYFCLFFSLLPILSFLFYFFVCLLTLFIYFNPSVSQLLFLSLLYSLFYSFSLSLMFSSIYILFISYFFVNYFFIVFVLVYCFLLVMCFFFLSDILHFNKVKKNYFFLQKGN